FDGPPERHGKIHGIQQQQGDAGLALDAVGAEQIGHAVAADLQLAVGQCLARIDERRLGAAAVRDVAVHHVDRGVVDARIAHRSSPAAVSARGLPNLTGPPGASLTPADLNMHYSASLASLQRPRFVPGSRYALTRIAGYPYSPAWTSNGTRRRPRRTRPNTASISNSPRMCFATP